ARVAWGEAPPSAQKPKNIEMKMSSGEAARLCW
ncbi:hypothetical protein KGM_200851B, partial [Danaus plexippus plexippus]